MMKINRLLAGALVLSGLLTGCTDGSSPSVPEAGPSVVVTTTILGDMVSQIIGDRGVVEVLIPTGADPHVYQPSAREVASLQSADLVVANGLGLEERLASVLEAAAADGVNVFSIGERLDPLSGSGEHEDEAFDPHVWLDPLRMAEAAELIAGELQLIDPSTDWAASAASYADQLKSATSQIEQILAAVPMDRRQLVTYHDSLQYFAARFGLSVVGTVIPGGSTEADPSSAELAELVAIIEAEAVPAIFTDTTEPAALAETIAAEVAHDLVVVELYTGSLGEPGTGAETLIGLLVTNARLIAEALA